MVKMAKNRQPLTNELDAKSGPLETDDFGKNRQRAGDNDGKRLGPLETGDQEQCIDHIPYYLSG